MEDAEKMLVTQGEELFEEGKNAKRTVKPTKINMNKTTVLLVLMTENKLLMSVPTVVPPLIGTYLAISAMDWSAN